MSERLRAWTKEKFAAQKALLEAHGYTVTNRWRKGCKSIKLAPIVLGVREK